jgi:2-polyprenyl-3-methyl-5-hydroxy-6-metoxy-1,4-benzoquinol methylase
VTLKGKTFVLIAMIEDLEHLENLGAVLWKVSRILSANGLLLVTAPNVDSVWARARVLVTG